MDDLAAFLGARLDEAEAEAKATADADAEFWADVKGDGTFFAMHDPARVLREVEAKRAILGEHAPTDWTVYGDHCCRRCGYDDDEPERDEMHHWAVFPCLTIRHLAVVYSDHPDYRAEWKP